jgi:hypothetical protein
LAGLRPKPYVVYGLDPKQHLPSPEVYSLSSKERVFGVYAPSKKLLGA